MTIFISNIALYIRNFFITKAPMETKGTFRFHTYAYKEVGNTVLKLDLWYPNHKKHAYPLVLFAHGGGWISGFRNQPRNVTWCKFLASKGLATANIDYRLAVRNSMEDILEDYTDALHFVRENAVNLEIDKDRIVLMGLSAGGHLALLYASFYTFLEQSAKTEGIKGVAAYYSPSDLRDLFGKEQRSLFARFAAMATLKGSPNKRPSQYFYYSPIEWISERMVPTLVVHGKKDMIVPYTSSINFIKKLKSKNVPCKLMVHKEGGHGFENNMNDFKTMKILEYTIRFIKQTFK